MSHWFKQSLIGLLGLLLLASCQDSSSPKKTTNAADLQCYQRTAANCATYSASFQCSWNGTSCIQGYGSTYGQSWTGQTVDPYNCAQYNANPNYCTGTCQYNNGQCMSTSAMNGAIGGVGTNTCAQYTTMPNYCTGQCQMLSGICQSIYGTQNQYTNGVWGNQGLTTGITYPGQYPQYATQQSNVGGLLGIAGGLGAIGGMMNGGGLSGAFTGALQGMQASLGATNYTGGYSNGLIGTNMYPQTGIYPGGTYYPQTGINQYGTTGANMCSQYSYNLSLCTGQCRIVGNQCISIYGLTNTTDCSSYNNNPSDCTGQCRYSNGQCISNL